MNDTTTTPTAAARHTRTRLDQEQVAALASAIGSAPPAPRSLTSREALSALVPQMKEALSRGHTAESIAATLATNGLLVSARSVAGALRAAAAPGGPGGRQPKTRPARA